MKEYSLHREQFLPITLSEAWRFFSNPKNLQKITPADMEFKIVGSLASEEIFSGIRITYSVKPLLGVPVTWVTEIKNVNGPYTFTDIQLVGPYKKWEHMHTFEEVETGIKMTDHVVYSIPMGWLGQLAHALIVKNKLESIFDYRQKILIS